MASRALVPAAATTTADSRRPVSLPAVLGSLALGAVAAVAVAEPSAAVFGIRAAALVSALVATGLGVLLVAQPATERPGMSVLARRCAAVSVLAVATGFAAVIAQIVEVGGIGWSGLLSSSSRADVLTSGLYVAAIVRAIGFLLIIDGVLRSSPARAHVLLGSTTVWASFCVTGHAMTMGPRALVVGCMLVHVAAASTWIGGLVGVATVLRRLRAGGAVVPAARMLVRFSRLMILTIGLLMGAGIILGASCLGSVHALLSTGYGQMLLLKVGLLASVLLVAAGNHRRLVPAAARLDRAAFPLLARAVTAEQVGVLTVLVITTALANMSPGV